MTRRQKKRFFRFGITLLAVFCIGMLAGAACAKSLDEETAYEVWDGEKEKLDSAKGEEKPGGAADLEISWKEQELEAEKAEEELPSDWNLILVNQTHLIPEDFEVELKEIGDGHRIDSRIYDSYRAMIQDAKAEGVYIYVTSSYRDLDKQTELYEKKIEYYVMKGYSYAKAKELAAQVVAIPGTSEHQLGLALDLVSSEYRKLDEKQEETKGFQWLKEHCWEYGFILRYPNGKTDITGIIYEPWHFRYVGEEAAEVITKAGITLEEYLGADPVGETEAVDSKNEDKDSLFAG